MSCVLTIKYNNEFFLISDNRTSRDSFYSSDFSERERKAVRVFDDPNSLMGHVGSKRCFTIIKEIPGLTNSFSKKYPVFNKSYIRNVLIKKINEKFKQIGIIDNEESFKCPDNIIVARDDSCYYLTEEGSIIEINDFYATGSGSNAAHGAFLGSVLEPNKLLRALRAIRAAIKYDMYCGYPVQILSTTSNKYFLLDEEELNAVINKERKLEL